MYVYYNKFCDSVYGGSDALDKRSVLCHMAFHGRNCVTWHFMVEKRGHVCDEHFRVKALARRS